MAVISDNIDTAFAADLSLKKRIFEAIKETPKYAPLFDDIAKYHVASQNGTFVNGTGNDATEQPTKKRKLEDGALSLNGSQSKQPRTVILEAKEISFSIPQRKKLQLSIVQYGSEFSSTTTTFAICATNPATGSIEFEYPLTNFAYILRVSVPEKAQKQYNFCLLPPSTPSAQVPKTSTEAVIWTVNHGPLKSYQILSEELKSVTGTDNILEDALNAVLQKSGNKLVVPTDQEFVSALVESHRKSDKSYHVKAFRGSKDGFLFFLENGIFFGFKKPLAFFPFEEIDSVSYTAVLQRTFNLVVVVRGENDAESQEIEFSMLDQADFAGIDSYIKRHQLQDTSMAEARRAKQFKVNGAKAAAAESNDNDGRTELEKAEQELEDEEDELEEDYDPGSDGESEGSGSSDEEEDYKVPKNVKGRDLVKDELGSEAEDVEITEDEDDEEDDEAGEEKMDDQPQVQPAAAAKTAPQPVSQIPRKPIVINKPLIPPVSAAPRNVPDFDDEDQL